MSNTGANEKEGGSFYKTGFNLVFFKRFFKRGKKIDNSLDFWQLPIFMNEDIRNVGLLEENYLI